MPAVRKRKLDKMGMGARANTFPRQKNSVTRVMDHGLTTEDLKARVALILTATGNGWV